LIGTGGVFHSVPYGTLLKSATDFLKNKIPLNVPRGTLTEFLLQRLIRY
jgi:hypothetical protein